jgi:uncharacterized repeat protein (TIGR03803 family)
MNRAAFVMAVFFAVSACSQSAIPNAPTATAQLSSDALRDGKSSYKIVFKFDGANGSAPNGSLLDVNGQLYGTTDSGGDWSTFGGTVFVFDAKGKERVLHSFGPPGDGIDPQSGLVDLNGTIYGATAFGGKYGYGAVFAIEASGKERLLHSFGKGKDGQQPRAGLTALNGVLYGTTWEGGLHGVGTVFSVTTGGSEHVLYDFSNVTFGEGHSPLAGLTAFNGNLYGTTTEGGGTSCSGGTVFKITPGGKETTLHRFECDPDGSGPAADLIAVKGLLYGTTVYGGIRQSMGTVYKITVAGKERVLYSFQTQASGEEPMASLVSVNGVLYGTTAGGGAYSYNGGVVFSVDAAGHGKVIHSFGATGDGSRPIAGLTDVNGKLYGTTSGGGNYRSNGTIYAITP